MKLSRSVIRFLLEAAFIILVAAATAVAHLEKLWIALSVGGAWALVAGIERTAEQNRAVLLSGPLAFLVAGRNSAEDTRPTTESSLEPTDEHVDPGPPAPTPDPPDPDPAPPAPEPDPPRPEPGEPTPQLRSVPSPPASPPEPAPVAEPRREPAPVVPFRPRGDGAPREWNIWELERTARELEGQDPSRDEALAFLLLELRQFANADGRLPGSFDAVVRELFGESLFAPL